MGRPRFASESTIATLRGKSRPSRSDAWANCAHHSSSCSIDDVHAKDEANQRGASALIKLTNSMAAAHKRKQGCSLVAREVTVLGLKADVRLPSACWAALAPLEELGCALDAVARLPEDKRRQSLRGLLCG